MIETEEVKLILDVSIPTDRQLTTTRPDLVVHHKRSKHVRILEVPCAWEPLIPEREAEKRGKYVDLASDLATQLVGWRVTVHPLVVGDLGSVTGFVKELKSANLLEEKDAIRCVGNCQFEVLCKTVQFIRRQLSS